MPLNSAAVPTNSIQQDIKLTLYWKQLAQPKGFSQFSVASKSVGRESCHRRGVLTKQICLAGSNFWKSVSMGTSQPFTNVNSVIKVSLPISWCLCMPPFCVTVATLPNCSSNKRKKRSILFLDSRSILFHTKTLRSTFHSERKIDKTHPAPLKVTSWKAREPMETYQYPSFRISLHINIANILRNPMAFWGSQRRGHRRHKVSRWRTLQHFWSSHTRVDVSKERDENYIHLKCLKALLLSCLTGASLVMSSWILRSPLDSEVCEKHASVPEGEGIGSKKSLELRPQELMEYQSLVMVGKDWKAIPKKKWMFFYSGLLHTPFLGRTRTEVCNIDPWHPVTHWACQGTARGTTHLGTAIYLPSRGAPWPIVKKDDDIEICCLIEIFHEFYELAGLQNCRCKCLKNHVNSQLLNPPNHKLTSRWALSDCWVHLGSHTKPAELPVNALRHRVSWTSKKNKFHVS